MCTIMEWLGTPPLPWQRTVLDVLGEMLDAVPAYREVVFTTPRQSGKSLLILAALIHRCLVHPGNDVRPQRVFYSAQTGADARRKLLEDFVPVLERSPLIDAVVNVRRAIGSESVRFAGGSTVQPIASTASAGHGRTIDLGIVDEAFSDVDDRREQALIPAMITVPDAQLLITSTAGTDSSLYFRRKVDAGRASVEADLDRGVAYFEWSASDEVDLDDESTWRSFMPALGRTQPVEAVRHARLTMLPDEFARAFGNRWTRTDSHVIPWDLWLACRDPRAAPDGVLCFGIDVNPERTGSALVCASAGRPMAVEVVRAEAGVSWLLEALTALYDRHGAAEFVLDGAGPAGPLVPELERAGLPLRVATTADMARAAQGFFDRVVNGDLAVRPSSALDDAVAAARKRVRGDAFTWARRDTSADISPLVAASLACYSAWGEFGPAIY